MAGHPKPTIILIHGGFQTSAGFNTFIPHLKQRGYPSKAIQLPSTSPEAISKQAAGLEDDCDALRSMIAQIEGDVAIVAHSYGGIPATQGLKGLEGRVKTIVFIASPMPLEGQSLVDTLPKDGPVFSEMRDNAVHLISTDFLYAGIPSPRKEEFIKNTQPHALQAGITKLTYSAWKDIPSTYLVTTDDTVVKPERQEEYLAAANGQPGPIGPIKVQRIEGDHWPFVAKPEETADVIVKLIQEAT